MRLVLPLRNSLFILCLLCLAFVLDTFGNYNPDVEVAIIGGLISALGGIGSAIGNIFGAQSANDLQVEEADRQRRFQSLESADARRWQEKMWNLQNQYNTPSALKARLKEAGWNPFLADSSIGTGSNAQSVGTPSMAPSSPLPNIRPLDFGGFADVGRNFADVYSSVKGVDANSANQTAQANREIIEASKEIYRLFGRKAAEKYVNDNLSSVNGTMNGSQFIRREVARTTREEAESGIADVQYDIQLNLGKSAASASVLATRKNIELMDSQISRLSKQNSVSDEEIKELASRIARNYAEALNLKKVGDYYEGSSKQIGIYNKLLDLSFQSAKAEFDYNSGVRAFQSSSEGREQRTTIFKSAATSSEITEEQNSSRFIRYGERVIDNASKLGKVNFGFNKSSSTFSGNMQSKSWNNNWSYDASDYYPVNR